MPNQDPILKIQDLTVGHESVLLSGLSFTVNQGDRIRLAGPSGCGKTSILRCLMGLLMPVTGIIRIEQQLLDQKSTWTLRQRMGYVPQEPELGTGSVQNFFERAFFLHANRVIRLDKDQLAEQMERWYLRPQLLEKACLDLSGGEKQRIAIILSILLKRPILLLDEPTSALDQECRRVLYTWIQQSSALTFVIVSHDPHLQALTDQVIELDAFLTGGAHA